MKASHKLMGLITNFESRGTKMTVIRELKGLITGSET